jgi:hypothetical protein
MDVSSARRAPRAIQPASLVLTGALALAALACGSGDKSARDSATAAMAAASAKAAPPESCPATGHWELCAVKKRLTMSGLAPRDSVLSDTVKLGPAPKVYVAGGSALAVYLFPDSLARRSAARTLDSTKFIAPDASLTMRHEATAIQNDNLLAILYSQRDQQRERVSDALMAGAPQKH